jgi:hypothetical protein
MGTEFNMIGNINDQYLAGWYRAAKQITNGKESISRDEAITFFKKENIALNERTLDRINDDEDVNISLKELTLTLVMMDATLDTERKEFKFDGNIEDKTEKGGSLENTMQNVGRKDEFNKMKAIFEDFDHRVERVIVDLYSQDADLSAKPAYQQSNLRKLFCFGFCGEIER